MNVHQSSVLLAAATTLMAASSASATLAPNINVDGLLLGEPNITGISTTMGTGAGDLNNLINQTDFANFGIQYTSLLTDFDTFLNTAQSNANPLNVGWRSAGTTTGFISFTLDRPYRITGIGLWLANAIPPNTNRQLKDFSVYADTDADPNNGLGAWMGSFTAQQITSGAPFVGQAWGLHSDIWNAQTTRFIQLELISNYGATTTTSLGEVVFATVPEPMTLLGAGAAAGMGAFFKRRQKKAN